MLLRKFAILLGSLTALLPFIAACNSDKVSDEEYLASTAYSSTQVLSFSLVDNDTILNNLDSVFFSIDQVNARIFNADSLPVGTKVNALRANIVTSSASAIDIIISRENLNDTIIDYFSNTSAEIDFTNPVQLRIRSANGQIERTYEVKVNVHQVEPDTLAWNLDSPASLPTQLAAPTQQKTTEAGPRTYCLTTDGNDWCMAVTSNPATDSWQYANPTFGFTPDTKTLTGASDGTLYLLSTDGSLYRSADGGTTWSATGRTWSHIYGCYADDVFGLNAGQLEFYPSGRTMPCPEAFPVSGNSDPITFESEWAASSQLYMTGGRLADGTLCAGTWAFDGSNWQLLAPTALPAGIEEATVVPYFAFKVNTKSWRTTRYTVMLLMGGRLADGTLNTTVYLTYDYGMNWVKAPALMQLPESMEPFYGAQAVVVSEMLGDVSRASRPITEWECPYIYLFGGYDSGDALLPRMLRGVINRLTFKPLQ